MLAGMSIGLRGKILWIFMENGIGRQMLGKEASRKRQKKEGAEGKRKKRATCCGEHV